MKILLITNPIQESRNYISQLIQQAWENETVKDKRKIKKDFLKPSDDFKIINSSKQFESFDFKFVPDVVFIVPELMWKKDGINEGYEIALLLLKKHLKNEFFQLIFLSILDMSRLKNEVNPSHIPLVNSFPHFDLLSTTQNLKFEYYSNTHFNLIKSLLISELGRIQKIKHDFSSLKSNIRTNTSNDIIEHKEALLNIANELMLSRSWTSADLNKLILLLQPSSQIASLEPVISQIEHIIAEILDKLLATNNIDTNHKRDYKVLIIEDEQHYQKLFTQEFSKYYNTVFPDNKGYIELHHPYDNKRKIEKQKFSIIDIQNIIKTQAKKFNIFIIDLLFLASDKSVMHFNGLDLYALIKKYNPAATIRIITNLPREVVAKKASETLNEKIVAEQIITKSNGDEALKYSISERIALINAECEENISKITNTEPFPANGIFKNTIVRDDLFQLIYNEPDKFNNYVDNAFKIYEQIKNKSSYIENWNNGELPSPKEIKNPTCDYFRGKLTQIITHRLFVLHCACQNIDFSIDDDSLSELISDYIKIKTFNKGYFVSKLGFSVREEPSGNGKPNFSILPVNLFMHEKYFITEMLKTNEYNNLKPKDELYRWFLNEILSKNEVYENWDNASIGFNPYLYADVIGNEQKIKEIINTDDINVSNISKFLQTIIDQYNTSNVMKSLAQIISDSSINLNKTGNTLINSQLNYIFENLY